MQGKPLYIKENPPPADSLLFHHFSSIT